MFSLRALVGMVPPSIVRDVCVEAPDCSTKTRELQHIGQLPPGVLPSVCDKPCTVPGADELAVGVRGFASQDLYEGAKAGHVGSGDEEGACVYNQSYIIKQIQSTN